MTSKVKIDMFISELSKLTNNYGIEIQSIGGVFLTDDSGNIGDIRYNF